MKNTTAQKVDPDRVEMASGYRMKTRPAPARNIQASSLLGRGSELQVGGERLKAPWARPVRGTWSVPGADQRQRLTPSGTPSASLYFTARRGHSRQPPPRPQLLCGHENMGTGGKDTGPRAGGPGAT